MILFMLSVWL